MSGSMATERPARVFISHSHADNDFGVRLAEDLRRALGDEQSVWYDVSGGPSTVVSTAPDTTWSGRPPRSRNGYATRST